MAHLRRSLSSGHLRNATPSGDDPRPLALLESAAVSCPTDSCASLPSTFVLTLAGLYGNCSGANGTYTLTRTGITCDWRYTQPDTEGFCDSTTPGSIVSIELQCTPLAPYPGQWILRFLLAPGNLSSDHCSTSGQSCTGLAQTYGPIHACGDNDPTGEYAMVFSGVRCPTDCIDAHFTATIS